MGQGVHTGSGGQGRRHAHHQDRVVDGDAGVQRQSTMAIFTLREVSVMMQKRVISEAVPAVVFTAR